MPFRMPDPIDCAAKNGRPDGKSPRNIIQRSVHLLGFGTVCCRRSLHARKLRENGSQSSPLDVWIQDPNRILATLLVGNNIANVGAAILSAFLVGNLFEKGGLADYAGAAGFVDQG